MGPPQENFPTKQGPRLYKSRTKYTGGTNFMDSNINLHTKINHMYRIRKIKEIMNKQVKDLSGEPDVDALDF